mgnify:CR=1 FL=1
MSKIKRPYAEVATVAVELIGKLTGTCERIEMAGSLRRLCPEVGDIELVAIPRIGVLSTERECDIFGQETVNEIRGSLLWRQLGLLLPAGAYTKCGEKYRQFVYEDIQVDLFTSEIGNWGWSYLIRTGSAEYSHHMAGALNKKGYTSQLGYIRKRSQSMGERIETPEEEDVFRLAGVNYVDPVKRCW